MYKVCSVLREDLVTDSSVNDTNIVYDNIRDGPTPFCPSVPVKPPTTSTPPVENLVVARPPFNCPSQGISTVRSGRDVRHPPRMAPGLLGDHPVGDPGKVESQERHRLGWDHSVSTPHPQGRDPTLGTPSTPTVLLGTVRSGGVHSGSTCSSGPCTLGPPVRLSSPPFCNSRTGLGSLTRLR